MSNPDLPSMHLVAPVRREEFRRARAVLFGARGGHTTAIEHGLLGASERPTTIEGRGGRTTRYLLCLADRLYPLHIGLNTIGRFGESDVLLRDDTISRRHCALLVHAGGGCELHDLASRNGTFLNGHRLTRPTWLAPGDEVRLCDYRFRFAVATESASDDGHTVLD
jgi:hypothetical protein